jgi:phospho-N-acetylmuramoyl-pentapeptide-transferase
MLFHLLYPLHTIAALHWLNVLRYVSTRTLLGMLTALGISLLAGPWFIRRLQAMQIGERVRDDGPASHAKKAGTPTMGGSLILFAIVTGTVLWCDLTNPFIWTTLLVTVGYGAIGFVDDYLKLTRSKKGLPGRVKLVATFGIAAIAVAYLFVANGVYTDDVRFHVAFPMVDFDKHPIVLGWDFWSSVGLYTVLGMFVVVGSSHAVNLTDGLDGLAIGPVIIAGATFLILTYAAGAVIGDQHFNVAHYLHIPFVAGSGELAIFCASLVGAGVGFLWYNAHPAQMFMGDVGSLSLGGALGMLAVATKNEFTLVILGGVFVAEAVSVMMQVSWFKWTKKRAGEGRRIFLMTPLHHHFEKKGWAETKVTVRFWIIAFALALVALATLKVR